MPIIYYTVHTVGVGYSSLSLASQDTVTISLTGKENMPPIVDRTSRAPMTANALQPSHVIIDEDEEEESQKYSDSVEL